MGTHANNLEYSMENLASALFDLYDVRAALTRQEKQRPKDNDGSSITIGDCLDDAISFLESLENQQ
jgi:hypothetical protein